MMRDLEILLFATAAGLTLSGIVANLYRIVAPRPRNGPEKAIYYAVITIAGASVLFENATRSFRKKACSAIAYAFAVTIAGYWSFALGIFILAIWVRLRS